MPVSYYMRDWYCIKCGRKTCSHGMNSKRPDAKCNTCPEHGRVQTISTTRPKEEKAKQVHKSFSTLLN